MLTFVSVILIVLLGLLGIPVAVLLIEILASLNSVTEPSFDRSDFSEQKRVAVIVPAHNESTGIIPTIADIRAQLGPRDRLIVVADNCSDDTATVAAAAGAEVITRNDLTRIGKGYALGFGVNHAGLDPPDFVVFIDADCRLQLDRIRRLKDVCGKLGRPIQACFLMKSPENSPIDHSLAEFAWIVRNWARPLGLRFLNCPVQLMGTGMIFPWNLIRSAPLASGDLVEDMKLGLDLAVAGKAPYFFPFVIGTSEFPTSDKGVDSQRQRWVQGHIGMIWKGVPRLLFLAITRRNFDLLVITLDLAVPPLSLLGLLVIGTFMLACISWLFGASTALFLTAAANLAAFVLAILLAWLRFGRTVLSARAFTSIGALILKRIRLYFQMLQGRTATSWVRTDRSKSD
jgi:cellulose synthase/poly-beta-1,6-N-acetylglucosamine synthase-like glycosyltransferase